MPKDDGPLSDAELRGWYMYDFANSPYFQVYICGIFPILCKWLAEGAAARALSPPENAYSSETAWETLGYPGGAATLTIAGMTAGSFPGFVGMITTAVQIIGLLSFAAVADYGDGRKRLLMIFTYVGAGAVFLTFACGFGSWSWWLCAVLRIIAGFCFVIAMALYNAFMPKLVASHPRVVQADRDTAVEVEIAVSDEVSTKGMLCGYVGGVIMIIASYVLLLYLECDKNIAVCTEVEVLLWPAFCCGTVGIWWAGFATYTFSVLRTRPGPEMEEGTNACLLGWREACETVCYVRQLRNTALFCIAYFIYSDSQSTFVANAVLIMDSAEGGTTMSNVLFGAILANIAIMLGIFVFGAIQSFFDISGKGLLVTQLLLYALVSIIGGSGLVDVKENPYVVLGPGMILLGSSQSISRSIFSSLAPAGKESSMFSFYEITDKGSNLVGGLISFIIHNVFHDYTPVFWYLVLGFASSAWILCLVDVEQGLEDAGKGSSQLMDSSSDDENYS